MFTSLALRLAAPVALLASLTASLHAQGTTGVPGVNDYTIGTPPSGSGTTSCTFLTFPGFSVQTFRISSAPGVPVAFLFTTSPNCRCLPCFFPLPLQAGGVCGAVPPTACGTPPTNQSLDLFLGSGCGLIDAPATTDSAGNATLAIPLPPPGFGFGTQAIALHPCATPPFPALMTQAFDVIML